MRTTLRLSSIAALCLLSFAACRPDKSLPPGGLSTYYNDTLPRPDDASDTESATDGNEPTTGGEATPDAPVSYVPGPGGFPLPQDASEESGMAPKGVKMTVFKVPRSRDLVSEELRANLETDGWTIDSEELSPSHRALRWKLAKAGNVLDVRITGDGNDAAIIITEP